METTKPPVEPEAPGPRLVRAPRFYKQWMLAGNPALFLDRVIQDFGDFVHCRGLVEFYLINHPPLVKEILKKTHRTFDKNSIIYNRYRHAFGDSLAVAEGEHWRRQRRLLQPMFSHASVRGFFDMMQSSAIDMADRWESLCEGDQVFDIAHEMSRLTLEIGGRAFFSDGFDSAADRIGQWSRAINRYSGKPPVPIVSDLWFPSPTNLKFKRALREFHAFIREMIASRLDGKPQDDLLSVLLAAKDEESGKPMSEQELLEEILGMIIGGHETSSSALTWIWYELARHPEVERRLLEEIDSVCGGDRLSLDNIGSLKYTKMVIDETLRLHPPFWFENRNTMTDLELGGAPIRKGTMVIFSRYSLHRNRDYWDAPEEFRPERFDPENEENHKSSYAHIPFGGGSRICIGKHFAMMELLVIVAVVLQRYRVVVDGSDRHQMAAHLTMEPKNGVRVRLEKRSP